MSTIKNPVGPQPSNVYWRRRLLVILGILVVILIIVLLIIRPHGKATPTGATTPKSSSTPSAAATMGPCKAANISVDAVTDALSYGPTVDPKFSLAITNTGAVACTFSVGTDVQDYEVTTGSQKVWSSKDCQTGAVALTETLQPDTPVRSTPFAWNRTASDPATCKVKSTKQVIANGASYHLSVTVNGVMSKKSVQFVLAK